jgi:hypothetical protein
MSSADGETLAWIGGASQNPRAEAAEGSASGAQGCRSLSVLVRYSRTSTDRGELDKIDAEPCIGRQTAWYVRGLSGFWTARSRPLAEAKLLSSVRNRDCWSDSLAPSHLMPVGLGHTYGSALEFVGNAGANLLHPSCIVVGLNEVSPQLTDSRKGSDTTSLIRPRIFPDLM